MVNELYSFDFFDVMFLFFIYSFIGWLWEVFFVFLNTDQLVNRGFVNGPLCPIYGVGAVIITLILNPFHNQVILMFLVGMAVATVVEFITAFIMESLFGSKWWDYSDKRFNIKGRICLSISLGWGLFSLVLMKIINPVIFDFLNRLPKVTEIIILGIILFIFIIDFTYTAYYVKRFNRQLERMTISKEDLKKQFETIKIYDTVEEFHSRIRLSDNDFVNEVRERLQRFNKLGSEELEKLIEELKVQRKAYSESLKKLTFVDKRLIKAFPKLKSFKNDEILNEIMERLNKNKKSGE